MSKCLHNLSLGTCHLYIYVSLKWKIKFERKKNTRWDFIFLSIKQRKQIVNFSYYIWFQFYTYNISYSTREKFINLSWVGIQCDLYCIQREVFVVIFECTDFFLTSLIMKDITLEFWKVRTFILKVFMHGLNYYFWQIYLHICQVFFFQMQSSCTFYTCMHFLLIISMVIALIPIFHANYTVHHIKKSMQSISWIFWLRIKGDVQKDLSEEQRPDHGQIALWLPGSCWPSQMEIPSK